jgi:hypothetical protein
LPTPSESPSSASWREKLSSLLASCRDDPDLFNSAVLGRQPFWSGQRRIAGSLVKYLQTLAYTGNAIGKDYLLGSIVPWWLYTRPRSLVIVTGPSQTLLGTVTWKEVRLACRHALIPLGPTLSVGAKTSPQICAVDPQSGWQALGYSTTSVERASGQHNANLLVIVEEASGVEDDTWQALDSLKYRRLLAIGNPLRAEGEFINRIRQADQDARDGIEPELSCNAIRIRSTSSPHAALGHSPFGLADKTWLADVRRRYGADSLWYRSHVLAEIPAVSAEDLIPKAWLDRAAAVERPMLPPNHPVHRARRIAVDLGEGVGRDSTAILVRDDHGIIELVAGRTLGLAAAAQEVARLAAAFRVDHARISYDKLGIGRDFVNHLARHGITLAVGYAGSGRAQNSKAFVNLRSEAAWALRRRLDPDRLTDPRFPNSSTQPPFHIPPRAWWARLREDLEALTYDLAGNKTRLVSKEQLLDRLGRSPDCGDALIQSFAFE